MLVGKLILFSVIFWATVVLSMKYNDLQPWLSIVATFIITAIAVVGKGKDHE